MDMYSRCVGCRGVDRTVLGSILTNMQANKQESNGDKKNVTFFANRDICHQSIVAIRNKKSVTLDVTIIEPTSRFLFFGCGISRSRLSRIASFFAFVRSGPCFEYHSHDTGRVKTLVGAQVGLTSGSTKGSAIPFVIFCLPFDDIV